MIRTKPVKKKTARLVPRKQKIYAVSRHGLYWTGDWSWSNDIRMAKIYPEKQARSKIRIDIGMSGCELVEVMPVVNSESSYDQV